MTPPLMMMQEEEEKEEREDIEEEDKEEIEEEAVLEEEEEGDYQGEGLWGRVKAVCVVAPALRRWRALWRDRVLARGGRVRLRRMARLLRAWRRLQSQRASSRRTLKASLLQGPSPGPIVPLKKRPPLRKALPPSPEAFCFLCDSPGPKTPFCVARAIAGPLQRVQEAALRRRKGYHPSSGPGPALPPVALHLRLALVSCSQVSSLWARGDCGPVNILRTLCSNPKGCHPNLDPGRLSKNQLHKQRLRTEQALRSQTRLALPGRCVGLFEHSLGPGQGTVTASVLDYCRDLPQAPLVRVNTLAYLNPSNPTLTSSPDLLLAP